MTKRIAIYARVSTDKQTVDNQLIELRSLCERLGYTIVQEYTDNGISGAKSRSDRPALDALMKAATQRKFDMVMCWRRCLKVSAVPCFADDFLFTLN